MLSDLVALASPLAPLLFLAGFYIAFGPFLDRASGATRLFVALLTGALSVRYLVWRFSETVFPFEGTTIATAWVWGVSVVELLAFVEVATFLLIMSRPNRTAGLADSKEHALRAGGVWPSVDVFIPTYNEGLDVLEKSIIGARAIDYPNYRVWVLDDGRRQWLREFCEAKGVNYLTRADNAHAKAGNMNNGLAHSHGDLVAVFDADFVPHRNFLRRTVGLFADPEIGLVQTPQHFFNKDPVQMNLLVAQEWPDEQRLFFDEMAASRDAWNAAFCCGSCSIMRRRAVEAIGGVPTASITEDLLTTLAMRRKGFRTVYLNEKLSIGLAAEGLEAFFIQRARWCQGGVQTIFLREGPLGPGLNALERLMFFPTSWVVQYPVRFMALLIPVVYLLTGLLPLHFTSISDLLFFQGPVLLGYALAMRWLVGDKYMPLLSSSVGTFATFRLLPTVIWSLVRPFGKPFQVTPKGNLNRTSVDWFSLAAIMTMVALTAAGLLLNSFQGSRILDEVEFFPVAAAWALFNLVMLILASLICFDVPRKRKEERFFVDRAAAARLVSDEPGASPCVLPARVLDMSLSGVRIELAELQFSPKRVALELPGVSGTLAGAVVSRRGNSLAVAFEELTGPTRDSLISYLFSGQFNTDRSDLRRPPNLWRGIWRRFAGEPAT